MNDVERSLYQQGLKWIDYQMYEEEKRWYEERERRMYEELIWYKELHDINILKLNKNIIVL